MWTTYGSYNSIRQPILGDALRIVAYDTFYSFFAGIAMFCIVGYLQEQGFDVNSDKGIEMAYVAIPSAIAMTTKSPRFWSCCLFGTWFIFGLDT